MFKKQVGIIGFILSIFIWAEAIEVILIFIGLGPALSIGLNLFNEIYAIITASVILAISIGMASFSATNKYELPDNLKKISLFYVGFVLLLELVLLILGFPFIVVLPISSSDYFKFFISLLGYALVKGPFVYFFLYLFTRKERMVS